ncbi:MAG: hypothetical protein FWF24_03990 [Alphaproteobacteria bacterium]|nr:hypothetical protein [Alphaproteobacteria bacterium]
MPVTSATDPLLNSYVAKQAEIKAQTPTQQSATKLNADFNMFLRILITQLKHQDPTAPMDPSQFTQQLVQYSQVEQLLAVNDKLDTVLGTMNSNGITPLLGYVGHYAETSTSGKMVVQGGAGLLAYDLPYDAQSVVLSIQDERGNVIARVDGTTARGLNRIAWDGMLSDTEQVADGVYNFVLTAKDSRGDLIPITDMRVIGVITAVETGNDGSVGLKIGDLTVKDTDILSIFAGISAA